jgi:pimeloyl-ACP methyl ester carboxylesterase
MTSPIRTSPAQGTATPARPHSSTGATMDRRTLSSRIAAPVLIQSTSSSAGDNDRHLDAQSVLFIHGQPGSSLIWMRVLERLSEYGLHTLAVQHRGDGEADGEAVDQFANAAALGRLLDEQQRPPAVIVGHGRGAGLALALAATAPRHVRALVLVAPATGPLAISATDRVLATPMLGPALAWLGFQGAGLAFRFGPIRDRMPTLLVGDGPSDTREVVRHLTDARTWRIFTAKQRRLVTYARCLEQGLSRLNCPIFIVAGTQDSIASSRVVGALARRLPGAQTINTETGHLVPIDDPDAVAAAIMRSMSSDSRTCPSTRVSELSQS